MIHTQRAGVPFSQFGINFPQGRPLHLTFYGGLVVYLFFFFWKCQGSVLWHHLAQTGSNTHLRHFKMDLATARHRKCVLYLQCLDFPMCAQLQLVKQKYTYHPTAILVATEP